MFNIAWVCFVFTHSMFGASLCFAEEPIVTDKGLQLKRVELFPAGQGVFEYEGSEVGDIDLTLQLNRTELDDLLKSLVLKGFDTARVDYDANAERNYSVSQVVSSDRVMTRSELLQGMKGHAIQLTDALGAMSGVIIAVELQPHKEKAGQETEVITLRTADGIEQRGLSDSTKFNFIDKSIQQQIDQALSNLIKPKAMRSPATVRLKKKERGPAGVAFQTETAAWKCSYRIAKIEGEHQLVVSAVIDNNTGIDWNDVELVLIVDQPLGFHAPLSKVHRSQRTLVPIPTPFSAAPPSLVAGAKRNAGQLLTDDPFDSRPNNGYGRSFGNGGGMGGMGGGGMGGMGMGGMGGMGSMAGGYGGGYNGYSEPQSDGSANLGDNELDNASKLGLSFPVGDLTRSLAGSRVHIRLPHVTIRAGESESVFLPAIPKAIDDVRVYSASVSEKHPLSGFQITLQEGYQLPGGPGTVWLDSGYAGDIMLPRLVAQVPQMVTYALDASIEVTLEHLQEHRKPSNFRIDGDGTLHAAKIVERYVRYTISNEGKEEHLVSIEHRSEDAKWVPVPADDQEGKQNPSSFRYQVKSPKQSVVTHDVLEKQTTRECWPIDTHWTQYKRLTSATGMTNEIRERLELRIAKLIRIEALETKKTKLTQDREKSVSDQSRIKTLFEVLNRQDELHARYLKRLAALENEIETTSEELNVVRKQLEDFKTESLLEGL